jgi:hypothetical protein
MDELAESPLSMQISAHNQSNEGKDDSGDENEMLDWTKLAYVVNPFYQYKVTHLGTQSQAVKSIS